MGLLDRRPGYYRVKITLTIFAFFAGWALFVMAGNSWAALAVAPLVGMMFTQLGFIGQRARPCRVVAGALAGAALLSPDAAAKRRYARTGDQAAPAAARPCLGG